MQEFVAKPSRGMNTLMIFGSAAFVAIGLWMIGVFGPPPSSHRYPPIAGYVVGWLSIIFFGFGAFSGTRRLFDTDAVLTIGSAGIRYVRWSDKMIPWNEIINVTTYSYKMQKFIILHLRDTDLFPGRGSLGMTSVANRILTGGDIPISMLTTDRSFKDAFHAIERFRQ